MRVRDIETLADADFRIVMISDEIFKEMLQRITLEQVQQSYNHSVWEPGVDAIG